jgi:hypothetical protein
VIESGLKQLILCDRWILGELGDETRIPKKEKKCLPIEYLSTFSRITRLCSQSRTGRPYLNTANPLKPKRKRKDSRRVGLKKKNMADK